MYNEYMNIKYLINIRLPAGSIPHAAGRVKEQGGGLVHGGEAGLKAARAAAPLKFFFSKQKQMICKNLLRADFVKNLCNNFKGSVFCKQNY